QALQTLTGNPNNHFRARLDYHNYLQLILYPWGFQSAASLDRATHAFLSGNMAQLALEATNTPYTPEQSFNLYVTTGSSTDYSYGVDGTPVPILVELRPGCCNFNVPENEIGPIDQESWAGAEMLLNWAAGPPILQSAQAYQKGPDGSFSRQVYAAHWTGAGSSRRMTVELRSSGLESGPLQVRLQFSKPMDASQTPSVSLGRQSPFNEITATVSNSTEGWQSTVYGNDTWVGETAIPSGGDTVAPWTLAVSAMDTIPLALDGNPATIADYTAGSGGWQGYEDAAGAGSNGGADTQNLLPPSLPAGQLSITVDSPQGGENFAGGQPLTVAWALSSQTAFIPSEQEIWFSTDSGVTFSEIAQGLSGQVSSFPITLPVTPTTGARVRVFARNLSTGGTALGDSAADFTIGANVGGGLRTTFVSSQVLSQSWSDTGPAGTNPVSGLFELAITINVTNFSGTAIANPFLQIATLTGGDVLLSRDKASPQASGATQSIEGSSAGILEPGGTTQVRLLVGLVLRRKKFNLSANLFGVPTGGSVGGAGPIPIWVGKAHNR
ncbi:MAG TPA: M14 family zinc carboxypeptidase, partial [Blastocatellia bacterium]|nr:M14 family zinc carboxypeptidase [Blastocatellia bacterium]